jgi:hypothetical protein
MLTSQFSIDFSGEVQRRLAFQQQKRYIERYKNIYKGSDVKINQDNREQIKKAKPGTTISSMHIFESGLEKNRVLLGLGDESEDEIDILAREEEEMYKLLDKFKLLILQLKQKNPKKFEQFVMQILKNKLEYEKALVEAQQSKPVIEIKF